MDIKGIRNTEVIQSDTSDTASPQQASEAASTGGISDAPTILEPSASPPGVPIPYPNNEVLVQFQSGDPREPVTVGNLWDSQRPPESNAITRQAATDLATFLFTDQTSDMNGLEKMISNQDTQHDLFSMLMEYQKTTHEEAREDYKSTRMPEASLEYFIGIASKLLHGDTAKNIDQLADKLDQLKHSKEELTAKLADGSVRPTTEQLNHLFDWISNWPLK